MAFNYIINKLEPINLYGLGFPLRYKKEEKYPSLIGIILSMVTIFFVIVISILYGLDLIFRTGYSIVTNYIPLTKKTLIDFSNRPLMFGFATNGGKISKFDPSYISLTFDRNVHNSYLDENGIYQLERISTQVEMEPCNISKHFVGRNEFMGKFDYHNFLCTKPNQNLNFGGRFGDNINGYDLLEIHLNKCVNSSKNNNICKSEEILDKFLDNSYLTMIYISESVDHSNISFPLIQSLRNELYIVAKEHVKRYYQYFQMASYSSDVGLIWNKIKKFNFTETKNIHTDFVKEEEQEFYSSSALLEIALTSTDEKTVYERKYLKLQEVLGQIGGFTDIVFIFFQFISDYFSKKTMIVDITNKIIMNEDIKIINPKKKSNLNGSITSKKSQIINNSSQYKIFNIQKKNLTMRGTNTESLNNNYIEKKCKTNLKKDSHEKKSKHISIKVNFKQFKISFYHYIYPLSVLEKWKKYDTLNFYASMFYKYMSIEVIIPLIERMSKMSFKQKTNEKENIFKLNTTVVNYPEKELSKL